MLQAYCTKCLTRHCSHYCLKYLYIDVVKQSQIESLSIMEQIRICDFYFLKKKINRKQSVLRYLHPVIIEIMFKENCLHTYFKYESYYRFKPTVPVFVSLLARALCSSSMYRTASSMTVTCNNNGPHQAKKCVSYFVCRLDAFYINMKKTDIFKNILTFQLRLTK